jgi:hypothetical protein
MEEAMTQGSSARNTGSQAQQATHQVAANPWVQQLGRLGIAARGVVYLLLGALATRVAFGAGGRLTDQQGVFSLIVEQPFGRVLLGLLAVGLVGYALWRFIQAGADTEGKGGDTKGLVERVGYAVSGIIHVGLALSAVGLLMGRASQGDASQEWTARLMAQPAGRWLVALVGLIVVGVGLYQAYKGYSASFREDLRLGEMSAAEQTWAVRAGRVGYVARGIVFVLIGGFVLLAALRANAEEARGIGGALASLLQRPFGPWLLGAVALGLAIYGLYCFVEARYRRMVKGKSV